MNMYLLFGPIGPELLIILFLLILLFGANKIPDLANSIGRSISEFERGRKETDKDDRS